MAVYIQIFLNPDPGQLVRPKLVFERLKLVNFWGWGLEILFLFGGVPAGTYDDHSNGVSLAKGMFATYGIGVGTFVWTETGDS